MRCISRQLEMEGSAMTLTDLLTALAPFDPAQPLVFETEDGPIAGGYHVTEFKLAQIESIDCGGRRSAFTEAVLQLLDGRGGARMGVGKFSEIAGRSTAALPGLGLAELRVEFAHGNAGKAIYALGTPRATDQGIALPLLGDAALCKPKAEMAQGCCGPAPVAASACC